MRLKPALIVTMLLTASVASNRTICMAEDAHQLVMLGRQLNRDDVAALEKELQEKPDDIESRTKLLGYYFINERNDAAAKTAKQRHILWLIKNAPEAEVLGLPYSYVHKIINPEGYDQARQSWLHVIEKSPENLSILQNASRFFLVQDPQIAEKLLLKGKSLDAKNPHWSVSLGQLYSLQLRQHPTEPEQTAIAEKAFQQYEQAYNLSDEEGKDALLSYLAKTAFAAHRMEDAKKYARQMLGNQTPGWNLGNRIHNGHLVLGRIALAAGDIDEAKSQLILAGKTCGSPQLDSFGPNMLLAKELLERGETAVVLEYFELCKTFWKSPHQELDRWIDDVKSNRIPQFGGNLAY